MRFKRCKLCGAIIYDNFAGDICDVCEDERQRESEEEQTDEDGHDERSDPDKGH